MTDKVTIQPKSKPEKTTISISGETSERLEIYCRANGILRKEFVSLALEYFERTGFDLKSNALDYSPLEKIIGELNEVKATMQTSNEGTEAIRQLLQAVREIPTLSFIIPYPTIYSFVRYHSYIFYLASAHYLLWAQILS